MASWIKGRLSELPASEREAFIAFVTEEVAFDMTRFYAISAMVPDRRRRAGLSGALTGARSTLVDGPPSFALPHAEALRRSGLRAAGARSGPLGGPGARLSRGARAPLVPRGAQWTAPILPLDWAAGAHDGNVLARLAGPTRDQRIVAPIGDAPWLGTFPEVFRDTARPAIADVGSDVTSTRLY